MVKVVLDNGMVVDGLELVKSNLRDYRELARRLVHEAEEHGSQDHRDAVVSLSNCLYFLSETVADWPVRKYKQLK